MHLDFEKIVEGFSREMVGSTTSLIKEDGGCPEKVLVKNATSSFSSPSRTRTTLSWIDNVAFWFIFHLFVFLFCFFLYLLHFPFISLFIFLLLLIF